MNYNRTKAAEIAKKAFNEFLKAMQAGNKEDQKRYADAFNFWAKRAGKSQRITIK